MTQTEVLEQLLKAVTAQKNVLVRSRPGLGLRHALLGTLEARKLTPLIIDMATSDELDWARHIKVAQEKYVDVLVVDSVDFLKQHQADFLGAFTKAVIGLAPQDFCLLECFEHRLDWPAPTPEEFAASLR